MSARFECDIQRGSSRSIARGSQGVHLGVRFAVSLMKTLADDDTAGTVQFDQAAFSVANDGGSITIKVDRNGGAAGGVTVDYATSDGTAHAGTDYTATAGTLVCDASEMDQSFTVPIVNDTLATGARTVNLTLGNVTGGATVGGSSSVGVLKSPPEPTSCC